MQPFGLRGAGKWKGTYFPCEPFHVCREPFNVLVCVIERLLSSVAIWFWFPALFEPTVNCYNVNEKDVKLICYCRCWCDKSRIRLAGFGSLTIWCVANWKRLTISLEQGLKDSVLQSVQIARTMCTHRRSQLDALQVAICTHCRLRSVHIAGHNLTHCTQRSVHIARATCTDRLCRLSESIGQVPVSWLFSWGWRSCW